MRCRCRYAIWAIISVLPLLAGCSHAPNFDIMGSLFPAWLVCLALGILLTFVVHWLMTRFQIPIVLPILTYPGCAAFFTFLIWLVFFG